MTKTTPGNFFKAPKLAAIIIAMSLIGCDIIMPATSPTTPPDVQPPPAPPPPPPPTPPLSPPPPPDIAVTAEPLSVRPQILATVPRTVTVDGVTRVIASAQRMVVFSWDDLPRNQRLPMFKSPKTPLKTDIPRSVFVKNKARPPSLLGVHDRITQSISSQSKGAGYDTSTLAFKGGFAILTQVERIAPDGKTLRSADGYRINMTEHPVTGLNDYVRLLFTKPQRQARAFAFIVTTEANVIELDAPLPTPGAIMADIESGAATLPRSLDNFPYTDDYTCTLLIYEYGNYNNVDGQIMPSDTPTMLSERRHIEESGILKGLKP